MENSYAPNSLERLVQEHAIYKTFFDAYYNREQNTPTNFKHPITLIKEKAFDVLDRLNRLNKGIPYYDPTWADADQNLFTISINSTNSNSG